MPETDQERWLTYRELGELLGCTANAARMHAHRRGWQRRAPNRVGGRTRVLVPEAEDVQARALHRKGAFVAPMNEEPNGFEQANAQSVRVLERAVEALREQLTVANRRIDELNAERKMLMRIITDPARRPWWRRWLR